MENADQQDLASESSSSYDDNDNIHFLDAHTGLEAQQVIHICNIISYIIVDMPLGHSPVNLYVGLGQVVFEVECQIVSKLIIVGCTRQCSSLDSVCSFIKMFLFRVAFFPSTIVNCDW